MGRKDNTPKPPRMPKSNGLTEIIFDIVLIALGAVLIIWPNDAAELMTRIVGVIMLILAVIEIIVFIVSKNKETLEVVALVGAIIFAGIGIFLIVNPGWLVSFFNYIFGVIIGLYGIFGLVNAVAFARRSGGLWWIGLILSVIAIAFAVLIFMNPVWISNILMIAIGVSLIVSAVMGIYNRLRIRKAQKFILNTAADFEAAAAKVDIDNLKSAGDSEDDTER